MTEQTNPQGGVAQEVSSDRVDRIASILGQSKDPAPRQAPEPQETSEHETEQPEGQAEHEEPAEPASEAEPEAEQPAVEAFEIVHNGQQIKLTLQEAIQHAQQGYDYTQKTQVLADKNRQADERLQRLAQVEQMQPHLQDKLAQVKSLETQLAPYQNVDWVALSQDPQLYAQHQAQFMTLQRAYQGAVGQLQQAQGQVYQHMTAIQQQKLAQEDAHLPSLIPEWRDPAKKEAGKAELLKYLTSMGASPREIDSRLDSAFAVSVAYKAMKYDLLQKSKTDKSKALRQAPPVTVPGAAQANTAKADKVTQLQQKLKKSGNMDDAVELVFNRISKR